MKREDIYKLPKSAGIYLIRNTINGKCYVGQALKIQKRLKAHWNNCKYPRYQHIALYKAINKYGIENFEVEILKSFRDGFDWGVRSQLDELEKKYIEQYDCYNKGYNSTLEGDGGVLGFKQSEETKKKLSQIVSARWEEERKDSNNWIKVKNIETGVEFVGSRKEASEFIGTSEYSIRSAIAKRITLVNKVWIVAKYNEDYPEVPEYGTWEYDNYKKGQFESLSNKEEIMEYIKENPYCTYGEVSQNYNLSKKTFFNYKNELGINFERRVDTKVTKEDFLEYATNHSKEECMYYFNIKERLYYKYKKKYGLQ